MARVLRSALVLAAAAAVLVFPAASSPSAGAAAATVTVTATEGGSVRSGLVPGRKGFQHIACPGRCETDYPAGATAGLIAKPAAGFRLARWTGACTGQDGLVCRLKVSGSPAAGAVFEPTHYTLTLSVVGAGYVTFPGAPVCTVACPVKVPAGSRVVIQYWPAHGHEFAFWQGACAGNIGCAITMDGDRALTGFFRLRKVKLHIDVVGHGRVDGAPPVACRSNCTYEYDFGTRVDLNALADAGFAFTDWDGSACGGGNPRCVVVMDGDKTVQAKFT